MLQFGASLTDDARSVNYDPNTFIIQATERQKFLNIDNRLGSDITFHIKFLLQLYGILWTNRQQVLLAAPSLNLRTISNYKMLRHQS